MKWLDALWRSRPALGEAQAAALAAYRSLGSPDPHARLVERVVVVDVETSGLDPFQDRLISIAGISVSGGLVRLNECFDAVLRQDQPSDDRNILVHGIGGSAQLAGRDPAAGLIDFLVFAGKAPLIAFHADFDRILIERASFAVLGMKPGNAWLDLALLAPALFVEDARTERTLDDWTRRFGIENYSRHNAAADALATAQLLLVVLAEASARSLGTWAQLMRLQRDYRWLNNGARL